MKHQRKVQAALRRRREAKPPITSRMFYFMPGSQNRRKGWVSAPLKKVKS